MRRHLTEYGDTPTRNQKSTRIGRLESHFAQFVRTALARPDTAAAIPYRTQCQALLRFLRFC
eukprot:scaffold7613_cov37-Prasinocladus_malaysianus.AAC.1